MRRIATAALLAAPLLLGSAGTASANNGPCTFGYGCPGFCLRLFSNLHQHGPLFNYGPYYGYPPFEPYGYWNSYLHYTGPVPAYGHGGAAGAGAYGWIHGGYPRTFGHGNPHPHFGHGGGLLHHGGGLFHKHSGCSNCETTAGNYLNSGDAIDRYNGVGTPAASAAYYAESPALGNSTGIIPVSLPGR